MSRKKWSNEKLFYRLIHNISTRTYWDNIAELRLRGTKDIWDTCIPLLNSESEKKRMIGVDVICQLGKTPVHAPFSKKAYTLLIKCLAKEKNDKVISSILYGIGHTNEYMKPKDCSIIIPFSQYSNAKIRHACAFALLGIDNHCAVITLINLSKDKNNEIRNWSVFGLGNMIDMDTPEIRQALYDRINDSYEDVRFEAICGLVRRKDERIYEIIKNMLTNENEYPLLLAIFQELPPAVILPELEKEIKKIINTQEA